MSSIKPIRIQRSRKRGFKMPPNTVYCGRGSRWGNPYKVDDRSVYKLENFSKRKGVFPIWSFVERCESPEAAKKRCLELFSEHILPYKHNGGDMQDFLVSQAILEDIQSEIGGKNLACWCKLEEPCHVDIYLELANGGK